MIRKLYTPSLNLSGPKGQQVLSPGQRPGYRCIPLYTRPDRAKAFTFPRKHGVLLHFQRDFTISISPRALPWAKFYWAFSPFLPWWWDKVTHPQTITLFLILRFSAARANILWLCVILGSAYVGGDVSHVTSRDYVTWGTSQAVIMWRGDTSPPKAKQCLFQYLVIFGIKRKKMCFLLFFSFANTHIFCNFVLK